MWDEEWQKHVLTMTLTELKGCVQAETCVAFEMYALQDRPVQEVTDFLNLFVSAIYTAKSRCISALKKKCKEFGGSVIMGKHYTKTELDLYRNRQMSVLGRISCAAHLETCPECIKLLGELKADDELIKELRASVQVYDENSKTVHKHEKK